MVNNEQEAFNHAEKTVCGDCLAVERCDGQGLDGRCKDFFDAYNAAGNGIAEKRTEKLNELKNRISLALKDGTLQQGFEIICKKLSQLEKENEQLKKKNGKMKDYIIGYIFGAIVTIVIIKFGLIWGILISVIGPFVADMCSSKED